MRIDIYNNCNGKTTIKDIPFLHKDFAENEDVFLRIYYEQLTDVLASAIFAHRHDGSYYNINSLYKLSTKITTFLKSAAKKNYRYEYWYSLVKVAEDIKATSYWIINPDIISTVFDNDKTRYNLYIEEQYNDLFDILTHILPTYKKGDKI